MATPISIERKGDIVIVWADNPPVNAISHAVRAGLWDAFGEVANHSTPKAAVLACRGRTFFAGADIREFGKPFKEPHLQDVFDRMEKLEIPLVAAVFGTALGGGCEAALACHYRICQRDAKLGLPEVGLGIIPGAGGTQRLPRLIGVKPALEMIIGAKPVNAERAEELGLVDKVVEKNVADEAIAFAERLIKQGKGPRRTSEMEIDSESYDKDTFSFFENFANARLKGREAPHRALEAVRAAIDKPFAKGIRLERDINLKAKQTLESRALRHVFFAERKARHVPGLPEGAKAKDINSAGVIGAGTMGRGIAMCFANAGIPVKVVEAEERALRDGLSAIESTYESAVSKGRLNAGQKAEALARIKGSLKMEELKKADIVVEAVFEDMDLKKKVFRELDGICANDAILATNTSTLDVNEIAAATGRPERVLGLHFFSPAHVMPLLEVVRGEKITPEVLKTAFSLAKRLRKTPVLSGVCFGFIGNRMLQGYGREAQRMLLEGASPRDVDSALEDFGFAMGVLAVYDLAGIDVGHRIRQSLGDKALSDPTFFKPAEVMYQAGRFGQKTNKGFYRYGEGRKRFEDPEAEKLIRKAADELGIKPHRISRDEILERCLCALINEGANILDEGIALRAGDIDVVWTSGYGFPRHKGGPMFYADELGLGKVLEGVNKYRKIFGPEFWTPSPLLERLVKDGKTFRERDEERG